MACYCFGGIGRPHFALGRQPRNGTARCALTLRWKARSTPVPITMICPKDLELIALREIRSLPGGEYVCHIEIEPTDTDWTLVAVVRDSADNDRIHEAVTATTNRLKQRYLVRFDW